MHRPILLLLLAFGVLAFGLPTVSRVLQAANAPATSAPQEEGFITTSEGPVHFTLYWPTTARSTRTLVILAADARAAHPRPLRLAAKAAAAAGFAAVYLEPSQAPGEAAARLKGLLQRHAATLGLDTASVWTWVEGRRLSAPACGQGNRGSPLAALGRLGGRLGEPGALLRTTLELLTRSGCSVATHL
jgi:hypothetical protein